MAKFCGLSAMVKNAKNAKEPAEVLAVKKQIKTALKKEVANAVKADEACNAPKVNQRVFDIDFTKVKTVGHVVEVLKGLQFRVVWHGEQCPEQFKRLHKMGLLKEVGQ